MFLNVNIGEAKPDHHWYAAKTRHQAERKIKRKLDEMKIENFIPFQTEMIERNGKKVKKEKPIIPNLIFIRTDYNTALSLPNELGISINYLRNLQTKSLLIVPDKQMQDFMFLVDFSEEIIMLDNAANLKSGERVRVIKGKLMGLEGELIRLKKHKRVVVRIDNVVTVATAYIPGSFLERIDISGIGDTNHTLRKNIQPF